MTDDAPLHLPRAPRPGDPLQVLITHLDARGDGVGRIVLEIGPQRERRAFRVTVPGALPGEVPEIRVARRRRTDLVGRIEALPNHAPERVAPPCPHAHPWRLPGQTCGGCSLQQMLPEAQHKAKGARVRELLQAAGVAPDRVEPCVAPPSLWRYRNKMEFSAAIDDDGRLAIGLHPPGYRHDVVALTTCHLVSEPLGRWLAAVNAWLPQSGLTAASPRQPDGWLMHLTVREAHRTDERSLELVTAAVHGDGETDPRTTPAERAAQTLERLASLADACGAPISSRWWTTIDAARGRPTRITPRQMGGRPTLREILHVPRCRPLTFEIAPRAFFQPNPAAAETIYATVLEQAGLLEGREGVVLDLYCGAGTIALVLAQHAEYVVGVELQPEAVDNARASAALNGLTNTRFFAGDVGEALADGTLEPWLSAVRTVVVDPPRAGLMPVALDHLLRIGAERLVYVSCNPEALARDTRVLGQAGYVLTHAIPIDQFPHTGHIETVARFERLTPPGAGAPPRAPDEALPGATPGP